MSPDDERDVEVVLEPSPAEGGQLVLVDTALVLPPPKGLGGTTRQLAVELRKSASTMLASALAVLQVNGTTKAVRFRVDSVELTLLQSMLNFDGVRPLGILCAVRPEHQVVGEQAIARLAVKVRAHFRGLQ